MSGKTNLKINGSTTPEDVLDLPRGQYLVELDLGDGKKGPSMAAHFEPRDVIDAAKVIIEKGGSEETFYTQAEVLGYAKNIETKAEA